MREVWATQHRARASALGILAALTLVAACAPPPAPVPTPISASGSDLGFDPARLDSVTAYLQREAGGAFPGAVIAVGRHGRLALLAGVGRFGIDDPRPVDAATIYDLASLTKVVGLTTAIALLVQEGKLALDAPVSRYVPAFAGPGKDRVTLRLLLTHSSGIPAWRPLYIETTTRAGALALVDTAPLVAEPGRLTVYSDLGAIVLTQAVEAVTGERIDAFLDRRLFAPLQMRSTRFLPPYDWRDRIAPTERSADGTIIRGTVHDENAWRLGGVSGHAGLFSTAGDLAIFAAWLLDQWAGRPVPAGDSIPTLPSGLVRAWTQRQDPAHGSSRALGWDTRTDGSSAGNKLSPLAFGHTGFTGTSMWLDPAKDLFIILLTNRVHPSRENSQIYRVRPHVANLVVDALVRP
jgi:CubicO group peptidase (beta-lactamase class C family)